MCTRDELRLSGTDPSRPPSLPYRVQVLFESAGHAGDQVDVVVYAAAHAAVHQRPNGWLLGAGVEEILCFVVAVHRASGEAVLGQQRQHGFRQQQQEGEINKQGKLRTLSYEDLVAKLRKVTLCERISHSTEIDFFKQVSRFQQVEPKCKAKGKS